MDVELSDEFKKEYAKIKDGHIREKIFKALKKLGRMRRGKHLRHDHKGEMRIRVDPFRIIYRIKEGKVEVLCFDHRGKVY